MTTTPAITYRKTKAGEWVAYGPAAVIRPGTVTVTRRDGSTRTETIERAGKAFTAGGTQMAYGYLARTGRGSGYASAADAAEYRRNRSAYSRRRCVTGGNCSSFGSGQSCGAPDCDGY